MKYEPIKHSIGKVFNNNPWLRKLLYRLLDILLLRTWHIKKEMRLIKTQIPSNASILDAGCGFGQYCYYLSNLSHSWTIKGIDINDTQVTDCNTFFNKIGKYPRISFQQADLTKFVEAEKYHLIISVDVMEHIEDDIQVFRNFYASLQNKGMVLISTPSDMGGSDAHSHDDESFISEHVRNGYNINEIKEKLTNAGFSKVEARYQYGWPGSLSWKLSMKIPIILLNNSKWFFVILPFYYLLFMPICLILNFLDVKLTHQRGTGLIVKAYK